MGLSVLRRDAESLVLKPLRSMLKIVARYAKNPLASDGTSGKGEGASEGSDSESEAESWDAGRDDTSEADKFGNYETEQLIRAVSIITELLRLCWGKYSVLTHFHKQRRYDFIMLTLQYPFFRCCWS